MPEQVELSDELLAGARVIAEAAGRSVADQIELWALMGRALEPLLKSSKSSEASAGAASLAEAIREVSTEAGRKRLKDYLQSRPFPHFEDVAGSPGLLRRIEADGSETIGQFVNRAFFGRRWNTDRPLAGTNLEIQITK